MSEQVEWLTVPDVAERLGVPVTRVHQLLRDGGYDDEAAIRWLHTADDTLPGTPVQALAADRGKEVKRRAQALAI